ncbi:hypothetical protein MMPV_000099 [Pyropia vietnamensis]
MASEGDARPSLLSITPGGVHFEAVFLGAMAPLRLAVTDADAAATGVAFKIKTTRPTRYCVQPNTGVLGGAAGAETSVDVKVCVSELPPIEHRGSSAGGLGRDKFLVQAARVPDGWAEEQLGAAFWETADVMSYKLRVVGGSAEAGTDAPASGEIRFASARAVEPSVPSASNDDAAAAAAATSAAAAAIAAAAATAAAATAAGDLRRRQAAADAREAELVAALSAVRSEVVGARGELARLAASAEVASARATAARAAAAREGGGMGGGAPTPPLPTLRTPSTEEEEGGGVSYGMLAALCGAAAVAAKVAL